MNQALPAKTLSLDSPESPIDNHRLSVLCGERHANIQIIEQELSVKCYQQGGDFVIQGASENVKVAYQVLKKLYQTTNKG